MNEVLQCTPEHFAEQLKSQSLGTILNLKHLLTLKYEEVNHMRQAILSLSGHVPDEDKEKHQTTLNNLMTVLQIIEDRVHIVNAVIESRK